jgi:hypothetical protein
MDNERAKQDRRWAVARSAMDAEGVDALIVYGDHKMADSASFPLDSYFTNDRPGAMVIFAHDAEPVRLHWHPADLGMYPEDSALEADSWIRPDNNRIATHVRGLADLLTELHLSLATIGVAGLEPPHPFPSNPFAPYTIVATTLLLPHARFKPVLRSCLQLILKEQSA